jgi:hypothetical protein
MAILSESESTISRGEDGEASNDASQLDTAGEAILKLLHKAAGVAEANSRRALEWKRNPCWRLFRQRRKIPGQLPRRRPRRTN